MSRYFNRKFNMYMAKNDWKDRLGVVYSTNPAYNYQDAAENEEPDTLVPAAQQLRIKMERAGRKGKTVTIVTGFVGTDNDLKELGKMLKTKLSTGGSAKDGEIILQGDVRPAVKELLHKAGYSQTKG